MSEKGGDDNNTTISGGGTSSSAGSVPILLVDDGGEGVAPGDQGSLYKYRDFSNVAEDDDDVVSSGESPVPGPSRGTGETSIRVQKFPVKLYAILAQKEFHDIISWMPHGRSWKVLKPNVFESLVMPLFFEYSNYHSFNRLVNAWSFRRVSSGADRGSYYHELFLRGKPHLQKYMRRLPKTHKKLPMRKQDEPDFYLLDKTNPLPALEDAPIPGGLAASSAIRGQRQQQLQQQQQPSPAQQPSDVHSGRNEQNQYQQQQPQPPVRSSSSNMPGMRMPPPSFHHTVPRGYSSNGGNGVYPGDNMDAGNGGDGYVDGPGGYPNNSDSNNLPPQVPRSMPHYPGNGNNNNSNAGAFRPPMHNGNMPNGGPPMRRFRQGPYPGMGDNGPMGGAEHGMMHRDGNHHNQEPVDLYGGYNQQQPPPSPSQGLQPGPLLQQQQQQQYAQPPPPMIRNSSGRPPHPETQPSPSPPSQSKQQQDPQEQMKHMNQMRRMQMQQMQNVYNERQQQQQQPYPGNPASTSNDQMYGYPPMQPMGPSNGGDGGGGAGGPPGNNNSGGGMSQEEFAMMQQMRRAQQHAPRSKC